ncbi:MAG: DUF1464 family protein [Candidatus Methanoperedens sp.]|jgi:predicted butyrate kinase (DUF1464 family)|nr:DUF1464 family protein [Candidatus Methanoperedens sp.]PKL52830.1 MAG: DUF1464 domain-containing protein [Candidatus Methanoperedenaceae archaeon HGW-Methanoperedenaceae-1]
MVRVIGIDPGTKSFDLCGLEDDNVILDMSIPTVDISNDPGLVPGIIRDVGADIIVGPSGYGIPVTHINDIGERELFLMSLVKNGDKKSILGMRQTIKRMRDERFPVLFIPGVIHLPTVPIYRKFNKIDMGTADKLCCAALGIRDQALRLGRDYSETSFIMLEMGYGYTAATAVDGGQVVDGIGGSSGNIGYLSLGCMDAELAYLLGSFDKELIFRGGVETIAHAPELVMDNETAREAYLESAVKDVLALTASVKPEDILISGRLSRISGMMEELGKRLDMAPVRRVPGFGAKNVKEAAQGAAVIADGLAGGKYSGLIDVMRMREAKGTSLDYILLPEIEALKKEYGV